MCILDGNAYDAKCLEAGQEREEDLDGCSLLLNNKVRPSFPVYQHSEVSRMLLTIIPVVLEALAHLVAAWAVLFDC